MRLFQIKAPYDWPALLRLVQTEFAYMDGRIDPPSSMHRLTAEALERQSETAEIWGIEDRSMLVACIVLTPTADALYLGKLAVAANLRGRGLARRLITLAERRALALGLPWLELQARIELVANQTAFAALGFAKTAETAHEGYDRPTSITMRRPVKRPL